MGTLKLLSLTAITMGLLAGSPFGSVTQPADLGIDTVTSTGTLGPLGQVSTSIVVVDDPTVSGMPSPEYEPAELIHGGGGPRLAR